METEIQKLRTEATKLGIAYSPNIGVTLLQDRIDLHKAQSAPVELNEHQRRERKVKQATKLRRVIVTCMDMSKLEGERQGEYVMASNSVIPTIKKFVPYGHPTHLEQILVNVLEERKFQQRHGTGMLQSREVKEFSIQYLPDLTPKEAEDLKKQQALRKEASAL